MTKISVQKGDAHEKRSADEQMSHSLRAVQSAPETIRKNNERLEHTRQVLRGLGGMAPPAREDPPAQGEGPCH